MRVTVGHRLLRPGAALASAALAAGLLVAGTGSTATAATTVTVHQADFIPELSDTRSAGHWSFLDQGIALWTDNMTSAAKAAEYFAVSGSLADMAGSTSVWYGTQPQAAQQILFDADGTTGGTDGYNLLVGEPIYGGDWWATSGSWVSTNGKCPQTTGGSGSSCHGTLAEWAALLPDAQVYAGGFSLGSGVKGSGVLVSQTYGSTTYVFTDLPPTRTSTMSATPHKVTYGTRVTVAGVLRASGAGAGGQAVTIARKAGTGWVQAGTATTGADGSWSTQVVVPQATTLRATAAGYPTATTAVKVRLRVKAKPKPHALKVKVSPTQPGDKVRLYKVTGNDATRVAVAHLDSRSKVKFRDLRKGRYQAVAKRAHGYAKGTSEVVKVRSH